MVLWSDTFSTPGRRHGEAIFSTLGTYIVQKPISLTLVQSKLSNSLFMNLEIFIYKSCLVQWEFFSPYSSFEKNRHTEIHKLQTSWLNFKAGLVYDTILFT